MESSALGGAWSQSSTIEIAGGGKTAFLTDRRQQHPDTCIEKGSVCTSRTVLVPGAQGAYSGALEYKDYVVPGTDGPGVQNVSYLVYVPVHQFSSSATGIMHTAYYVILYQYS